MNIVIDDHADIRLERNGMFELLNGEHRRIFCTKGSIWVTVEGDATDIIVKEGESFVPELPGMTVVSALDDDGATVSIH